MAVPREPSKARFIIGILFHSDSIYREAKTELIQYFGPIFYETDAKIFNHTKYYEKEMGPDLKRSFLVFEKLVSRDQLAVAKIVTNSIEDKFSECESKERKKRKINLDPGIMTLENFVLASCKGFSHRIYLSHGVYADLTLYYERDTYKTLPWTYPDYAEDETILFLNQQRKNYKKLIDNSEMRSGD